MKKGLYVSLILLFSAGVLVGGWKAASYFLEQRAAVELYTSLAERVVLQPTEETVASEEPVEPMVLAEYAELLAENADLVGWIRIADTVIDYPVMQSPEMPNFYIDYGFDKQPSVYGCPYVQENCDVFSPSDNVIIYGHNMRDGMMFSSLVNYRDYSFYQAHPTIAFDTLYAHHTYEIIAVVPTRADESGLAYRQFVQAESAEEFEAYVERCRMLSLYDTGITAKYGDHLLTLSTCELALGDTARLIVVARQMED